MRVQKILEDDHRRGLINQGAVEFCPLAGRTQVLGSLHRGAVFVLKGDGGSLREQWAEGFCKTSHFFSRTALLAIRTHRQTQDDSCSTTLVKNLHDAAQGGWPRLGINRFQGMGEEP